MSVSEFALIDRFFRDTGARQGSTVLSQGDDGAVIEIPPGYQLVMSIDTLISGVHFPENTAPADIARKALAVNLSDLAAMAAEPAWFLLSVSLPGYDEAWLSEFSQSLKNMAQQYNIELIGGDTCKGLLSVTIQLNGLVRENRYMTRSGAQQGDLVVVSGQLGNAALGLASLQQKISLPGSLVAKCIEALNRPEPRLCLTGFLREYATSAIDISDGLVGDLRHITNKSQVGAMIHRDQLPVNEWVAEHSLYDYALRGGDDYELCFTMPENLKDKVIEWNRHNEDCPLSIIGKITESDYFLVDGEDMVNLETFDGYLHFGE
jgi:thiamine-monophosphate kinase